MSVLSEIFGDCPQAKIVEIFAENREKKLYVADIVRLTGISKATVYKNLKKLIADGVVEEKERAGNIRFYQLNASSPKAKIILALEKFIVSERLGKLVEDASEEESGKAELANMGSYGIEAASKRDGKTHIIGEFESFEDAEYFLEWELNQFEILNARVIEHTEKTSAEAIFKDRVDDFFDYKPPSWDLEK